MKCIGNVIKKINMERRRWLVYNSNVFFVSMSIAVGIKYVSCFINLYIIIIFAFPQQRACYASFVCTSVNARCTKSVYKLKQRANCKWNRCIYCFVDNHDYKQINLNILCIIHFTYKVTVRAI